MPLDFLSGHYLSLLLLLFIDCRLDPFLQITGFSRGFLKRHDVILKTKLTILRAQGSLIDLCVLFINSAGQYILPAFFFFLTYILKNVRFDAGRTNPKKI